MSEQTYAGPPTQDSSARSPSTGWPGVAPGVRRNMRANRGRDTSPELAIRSILHRHGLRFRVNHPLPFDRRRRADITFTRIGLFIFVDGCFWHRCPEHFVSPKTRTEFWLNKIARNVERDAETDAALRSSGNTVLRVWEHQGSADSAAQIEAMIRYLNQRHTPERP